MTYPSRGSRVRSTVPTVRYSIKKYYSRCTWSPSLYPPTKGNLLRNVTSNRRHMLLSTPKIPGSTGLVTFCSHYFKCCPSYLRSNRFLAEAGQLKISIKLHLNPANITVICSGPRTVLPYTPLWLSCGVSQNLASELRCELDEVCFGSWAYGFGEIDSSIAN